MPHLATISVCYLLLLATAPQVRNAQLDKEAGELRAENETLLRSVEEGRRSAVHSAMVRPCPCVLCPVAAAAARLLLPACLSSPLPSSFVLCRPLPILSCSTRR